MERMRFQAVCNYQACAGSFRHASRATSLPEGGFYNSSLSPRSAETSVRTSTKKLLDFSKCFFALCQTPLRGVSISRRVTKQNGIAARCPIMKKTTPRVRCCFYPWENAGCRLRQPYASFFCEETLPDTARRCFDLS